MFPIAKLDGIEVAFGPRRCLDIMPTYEECRKTRANWQKYETLVSDWFYLGLASFDATPRDGVNKDAAIRHIKSVLGSFEPKHEHKEAAVAYLIHEWFSDVKWKAKRPK